MTPCQVEEPLDALLDGFAVDVHDWRRESGCGFPYAMIVRVALSFTHQRTGLRLKLLVPSRNPLALSREP